MPERSSPETAVQSEGGVDSGEVRMTPFGSVLEWYRSAIARTPTEDEHDAVGELLPEGDEFAAYLRRFCLLIVLSASIAAFGLLSNSAAVVIGAMLVAPLMTPITAAAAATVTARNALLWRALSVVALGTTLAIAVGWLTTFVAGSTVVDVGQLPDEVQARTFPTLLDLGVAISAGAAAGYIVPRRATAGALPGVGIAVALVPPLAAVGITMQLGLSTEARNAFLLFVTNLAAIVFAAGLALLLSGFRPQQFEGRRRLRTRLVITVISVLVVAVPLYRHSQSVLDDQQLRSSVTKSIEQWDDTVRVLEMDVDEADGRADVALLVAGRDDPRPVWRLAEEIRNRFGGPVDLVLSYQRDEQFIVSAR